MPVPPPLARFIQHPRCQPLVQPVARFFRGPRWRSVAAAFGVPRYHRFEVVFMRVLFAYVLYQCMPLGAPYSTSGLKIAEAVVPGNSLAEIVRENDRVLRPPLPPVSQLLPNSGGRIPFDSQPQPDGLAKWFDLTFFHDERFASVLPWIVLPSLALYISGFGLPLALTLLSFVMIGSRTLYNSQGYIHHGFQMVALILLAQTLVALWALARCPREAMGLRPAGAATRHGRSWLDLMIRYSQLMIIASYMIPGVVKQMKSGGQWFLNSHYIGVQVVKTYRQNYYNDLDEKWEPEALPVMSRFMLEHKNWTRLLLGAGVALQLIAFLALWNRVAWLLFGLLFIAFHYLNDIMFGLTFYHVEKLDWIFLVNLPFWAWWAWQRGVRRRAVSLEGPAPLPAR